MEHTLIIDSWREGFQKIAMTNLIRQYSGLSLSEAKEYVDRILDGNVVEVQLLPGADANDFVNSANKLGANCRSMTND